MQWFYGTGGQQQGPIDEQQLKALVANGTVTGDWLAWKEGMAGWQAVSTIPELQPPAPSPPPPPPLPGNTGPLAPHGHGNTGPETAAGPVPSANAPPPAPAPPRPRAMVFERKRPWQMSVIAAFWMLSGLVMALGGGALFFVTIDGPFGDFVELVGMIVGALGLLTLLAGVGLWDLKGYGRALAFVVAGVSLFGFPLGTLTGVLLFVYLLSPGAKALFDKRPLEHLPADEVDALAQLPQSGVGTGVAVILIVSFLGNLLGGLLLVPGLMAAGEMVAAGGVQGTMSDMRTLATAAESYAIDFNEYPAGDGASVLLSDVLSPTYVAEVPATDAWGNDYHYEQLRHGRGYRITSFGADGVPSGPPEGALESMDHDIVYETGMFKTWHDFGDQSW